MFHFRLRSISEIQPWGKAPFLHYWALTDGCYWIRVGNEELFRYTPEIMACWKAEALEQGKEFDTFGEPYDAYQVMRLDQDLAEVLPHALEPVPAAVAAHVETVSTWRKTAGAGPVPLAVIRTFAQREGRDFSEDEELFYTATEWWGNRQMPIMHLRFSPRIFIWSQGDEVEVRWDNRHHRYKGIAVWTAEFGKFRLPRASFVQAIRDFRQRFVEQMGERVGNACRNWSRPDVAIDLKSLQQEQSQMEGGLSHTFEASNTNWDIVRRTLEQIVG